MDGKEGAEAGCQGEGHAGVTVSGTGEDAAQQLRAQPQQGAERTRQHPFAEGHQGPRERHQAEDSQRQRDQEPRAP